MIKKRILIFSIMIPIILGYFVAQHQSEKPTISNRSVFSYTAVLPGDILTLSSLGNIFVVTHTGVTQITQNQNLIDPIPVGNKYIAVLKKTNYSSLLEYSSAGKLIKTLFNGNTGKIDTMSWISDPAINHEKNKIAYVSDKDRQLTGVPDLALYELNLANDESTHIAKPDPYSGGLAHPVWNPTNSNILLYDYYQYDPKTLNPYSTIMEYNKKTGQIIPLTTDLQNAYQASFSLDGKKLLFLIRNKNLLDVSIYSADITADGLSNEHKLLTGDISYPQYSYTRGHIYFQEAIGNSGYNLLTATIVNDSLINIIPVTKGSQLVGDSSFSVTGKK